MTAEPLDASSFESAALERVAEALPDADLESLRASFDLIRLATQWSQHLETTVHRPAGWSMAGFRLLFALWVAGDLEPRDLARLSGLTRASITSALNTLERDGLVARSRESEDRRLVTVRLTDDGRARLEAAYAEQQREEAAFFGSLDRTTLEAFGATLNALLVRDR